MMIKKICNTLKDLLEQEGYKNIHTATSDKEAIVRIKAMRYDLILLDVRMPEMNGIEVLKEIGKYDEKVPVAMITAYKDENLAREALHLGALTIL